MFSIGLFSTHLPYLLLAMFYGAYIGIHSIMKVEQEAPSDPVSKEIVKAGFQRTSSTEDVKNCHFYDYFYTEEEGVLNNLVPVKEPSFAVRNFPSPRSELISRQFSRPPPRA